MPLARLAKLGVSAAYRAGSFTGGVVRRALGSGGPIQCIVLYYHGVTDGQRTRFQRQMEWLKRNTNVVSLSEALVKADHAGMRTCVTFDDAFDNLRRNAVPIFERLDLPATIFAVSGNLGQTPSWEMPEGHPDRNERTMTSDALSELPTPLIEVGSHTVSHANLKLLTTADLRRELTDSKRALQTAVGRDVRYFSVPFGEYTPETVHLAREVGYDGVLTSDPLAIEGSDDSFRIGRFAVSPDDWMWEFKLKAIGAYTWRRHVWRWQKRLPSPPDTKGQAGTRVEARVQGDGAG